MITNFWESLRLGFTQLRADCAIDPPLKLAGRLIAGWTSLPEPARWHLEHWNKTDGNGVTQRFKWHAQSAAARRGFAGSGDDAVSFWLDQIRRDAPESHIRRLHIEGEGSAQLYSFELLDICGLSADYCRKCEADETRSGMASVKTPTNLPELPPKFQNAFEAAKANAEVEQANLARRFPNPLLHRINGQKLIQDVFFAYCTQARAACRAGNMTVAQVRQATETALPLICDFYFVREQGDRSDEAKSTFRVSLTQVVTDDPQWRQHLSELAALAEGASSASAVANGGDGENPRAARADDAPLKAPEMKPQPPADTAKSESPPAAPPDMARRKRLLSTILSPIAARRMEAYLDSNPMKRTAFAVQAQTTDRTLRSFRKTGKVRRDIFENIAKAMGITPEALLNPE
jgi:hypothetical protein